MTAFSRPRQHVPKADAAELAELSAAMEALEEEEEGDLEDDFLLAATHVRFLWASGVFWIRSNARS